MRVIFSDLEEVPSKKTARVGQFSFCAKTSRASIVSLVSKLESRNPSRLLRA